MSCDKAIGKALRDESNRIDSMVAMLERDRQRIVNDYMQSTPPNWLLRLKAMNRKVQDK